MSSNYFALFIFVIFINHFCTVLSKESIKVTAKRQSAIVKSTSVIRASLQAAETCAEVCGFWSCTTYYCPDGVCCIPGSQYSNCCPESNPLCIDNEFCCPEDQPKMCETTCCKSSTKCCEDTCCDTDGSCCGQNSCCSEDEKCCQTNDEEAECCDENEKVCCEDLGCVSPCPSIFDAVPCLGQQNEPKTPYHDKTLKFNAKSSKIFRVLGADETCDRIQARCPTATKTINSHVLCGSHPKYMSQYISFTSNLEVAMKWYAEAPGSPGIAQVSTDSLPVGTETYDLMDPEVQEKYLKGQKAIDIAEADNAYILKVSCKLGVEGELIKPTERSEHFKGKPGGEKIKTEL